MVPTPCRHTCAAAARARSCSGAAGSRDCPARRESSSGTAASRRSWARQLVEHLLVMVTPKPVSIAPSPSPPTAPWANSAGAVGVVSMFELGIAEVEADGPAPNRAGRRSAAPPGPSWRSFPVFQVGVLLDDRSGHRDLAARAAGAVDEPRQRTERTVGVLPAVQSEVRVGVQGVDGQLWPVPKSCSPSSWPSMKVKRARSVRSSARS